MTETSFFFLAHVLVSTSHALFQYCTCTCFTKCLAGKLLQNGESQLLAKDLSIMAAFFANPRNGSRAKLQKKSLHDQAVEFNTYTPNAVHNRVRKPSLKPMKSAASLSSLSAIANPRPSRAFLEQLTRTTRALLSLDAGSSMPREIPVGKPKFIKRNDGPIFRFPSQKSDLLANGTEKLVQLEGDVIPGPGVKPKDTKRGPEAVPEKSMTGLRVINTPDPEVKGAFENVPRTTTPPAPLAASKPVPIRRGFLPLVSTKHLDAPEPTALSPTILPARTPQPRPTYRGVAAFRFGGSIPYRDADPEVSRPLPKTFARSNAAIPPAVKVFRSSPSSQDDHPNIPTLPPPTTTRPLSIALLEQIPKPRPNYRGVAAFRFGGSIPGPISEPKDAKPLHGRLTRLTPTIHKRPDIKASRTSPLSQQHFLRSPPHNTEYLTVPHSGDAGLKEVAGVDSQRLRVPELRRQSSLEVLERTVDAARKEVERLQHLNTTLHRRLEALEDKTLSEEQNLLHRIIALEKVNYSVTQRPNVRNNAMSEIPRQTDAKDSIVALEEQITQLQGVNNALTARIKDLKYQNEDLRSSAERFEAEVKETLDASIKAKEEAELNAEHALRNADTLLNTIEAVQYQNTLDRRRSREDKELLGKELTSLRGKLTFQEISCARHLRELSSKTDELSTCSKENESLKKEINVLWSEIGESLKKVDKVSKKKIDELGAKIAVMAEERATAEIARAKLKKEVEVLWGEIRSMHEKHAKPAKAARVPQSAVQRPNQLTVKPEGIRNEPPATVPIPFSPPKSPEIKRPATDIHTVQSRPPAQLAEAALRQMVGGSGPLRFRHSPMVGTAAADEDGPVMDQQQKSSVGVGGGRGRFGYGGMGVVMGGSGRPGQRSASGRRGSYWRPPGQGGRGA